MNIKKLFLLLLTCVAIVATISAKNTWKKGTAEWMKIQIHENFTYDKAFNTVLDLITDKYEMDLISKDGGYIRTAWSFMRNAKGKKIKNMRVRVTAKFNHDRSQLQVRTEVQKLKKDDQWIDGEDINLSRQIRDDIQGVLGL